MEMEEKNQVVAGDGKQGGSQEDTTKDISCLLTKKKIPPSWLDVSHQIMYQHSRLENKGAPTRQD